MTTKFHVTPPIVRVAIPVVEKALAEVRYTTTESPVFTSPVLPVRAPALIRYNHQEMEIAEPVLIPVTVIALEVYPLLRAAPVMVLKEKASGVSSRTSPVVVTLNAPVTPPIVKIAEVRVENALAEVRYSVTVCPEEMSPGLPVNEPALIRYNHQVIEIEVPVLIPVIVTVLEVYPLLSAALVMALKENGFGIVS